MTKGTCARQRSTTTWTEDETWTLARQRRSIGSSRECSGKAASSMRAGDNTGTYRDWSIVVTVGVWAHGNVSQKRFVPTVVVELPGNLQQRLVDVGGGAAILHRADAIHHGFPVAKLFVD